MNEWEEEYWRNLQRPGWQPKPIKTFYIEERDIDKMATCKSCKKVFHYCHNCGFDLDLYPLSEGYCCKQCMIDNEPDKYYEFENNYYDR